MAKVKYGGLAQDVRGSLNGNTHSRNASGNYVRAKASPVQVQSDRQLQQRAIFTSNAQAWRGLSDADRAAWNNFAASHPITDRFGDSIILSGIAAFQKINSDEQTLGLPMLTTPPPDPGTPPPAATAAAADSATATVTITLAAAADADDLYEVWTTRGVSQGVSFTNSDYRLAFAGKPGAVASVDIIPTDLNPALPFSAGQKVSVLIVRFSQDGVAIDSTQFTVTAA